MTPFVQGIKLLLLLKGSFPRKGSNTLKILHYFSEKGSYPSIKLCFKLKLLGPSLGQWCTVGDFHENFFREKTFPSSKAPHWHKTFIYVSKIETYQLQLLSKSKKVVSDTVIQKGQSYGYVYFIKAAIWLGRMAVSDQECKLC